MIACLVTVTIVVGFEMVDIDQQHRQRAPVTHSLLPHARELVLESATVLQSGEPVASGHLTHETALEEQSTQLPLHAGVNESTHRGGNGQHTDVIQNGLR